MNDDEMGTLQLFMFSLDAYSRIAERLPLSSDPIANKEDYAGISVRLMLQRKYVSRSERLYILDVIKAAEGVFSEDQAFLDELSQKFEATLTQPFQLALPDGSTMDLYHSVEDLTYGVLLHADPDKATRLLSVPESIRTLFTYMYVLEVEEILSVLYEYLIEKEIESRWSVPDEKAVVAVFGEVATDGKNIEKSPYWSNLVGRDGDISDVERIARESSLDERLVVLTSFLFIEALANSELDSDYLGKLVTPTSLAEWGDFKEVSAAIRRFDYLGLRDHILFSDDGKRAEVHLLEHINEVVIIENMQFIEASIRIQLECVGGVWKIHALIVNPQ